MTVLPCRTDLVFNQIHPDPVLKQILTNVKFRQAMSVAIDRDEINELVFLCQGTPRQATINSSAKFSKEEWGKHFAQFDQDLANKLLDEIGLDKKGSDGVRLRPDGKPLAFQLEYLPQQGPRRRSASSSSSTGPRSASSATPRPASGPSCSSASAPASTTPAAG